MINRLKCRILGHRWGQWRAPTKIDGDPVEWDRTCRRCGAWQFGGFGKRPNYRKLDTIRYGS